MENQRKNDEKEEEMNEGTTKNDPSYNDKMILGLITLKHSLDLLILSFGTPNPSLHYVPKKFI